MRYMGAAMLLLAAWVPIATTTLAAQRAIPSGTIQTGVLSFDGRATVGDFTGTTSTMTGELIGAADLSAVRGWVEAPVKTFVTGVMPSAARGDTVAVTLLGTFHIHGVSHEASIPATVALLPGAVQVRGDTPLNLKTYKIGGLSKALGLFRMQEEILIHLDLRFTTVAEGPASARVTEMAR